MLDVRRYKMHEDRSVPHMNGHTHNADDDYKQVLWLSVIISDSCKDYIYQSLMLLGCKQYVYTYTKFVPREWCHYPTVPRCHKHSP